MKYITEFSFKLIFLFLFIIGNAFRFPSGLTGNSIEYQVRPDSKVEILGNSNIAKFKCDCLALQDLPPHVLQADQLSTDQQIHFQDAVLEVPSKGFHCGNKGIDRDMAKTLKAGEYANIRMEVIQTIPNGPAKKVSHQEWTEYIAITELTIAGIKKDTPIRIKGKRLQSDLFHFQGKQHLLLSDFNLVAPKPMLGLIKIDDRIEIHFDLKVQVNFIEQ